MNCGVHTPIVYTNKKRTLQPNQPTKPTKPTKPRPNRPNRPSKPSQPSQPSQPLSTNQPTCSYKKKTCSCNYMNNDSKCFQSVLSYRFKQNMIHATLSLHRKAFSSASTLVFNDDGTPQCALCPSASSS